MDLFVMGGINFTNHIKVPSYKVNKTEEYEEWKDANYTKHREITRTKVSGSFTLLYDDETQLYEFLDTVKNLQQASFTGAIKMTLYLNNLHTTEEVDCFIKYTIANEKPYYGGFGKVSGFEVTVEER